MAKRNFVVAFALLAIGFSALVTLAAPPNAAINSTARMATFQKATGETYFALSLATKLPATSSQPTDVVILFDTSASQVGKYRDDAMAALKSMLSFLHPNDRVQLMAVDLNAIALTKDFVSPNSPELQAAIAKLEQRVPLGSTDMAVALENVTNRFAGAPTNTRAAVYIGDGQSRASLLGTQEFGDLMKGMAERRVSVSSYAIGPNRNVSLLAAIANNTGGVIYADSPDVRQPQPAGAMLAGAIHATVAWPLSTKLSPALADAQPQMVPPLRSDRDSILIGAMNGAGNQEIKVSVEVAGKTQDISWMVTAEPSNADFAFLPKLVEMARKDGGLSLPTVGSEGLREVARVMQSSAEQLAKIGHQALIRGDFSGAKQVADAVLANDPENGDARAIRAAASKSKFVATSREADLRLSGADRGDDGLGTSLELNAGRELDGVFNAQLLVAQKVKGEVEQGITKARTQMGSNAQGAKLDLKLLIQMIERTPELDPETRLQLSNKLENAIREAEQRERMNAIITIEANEKLAAANEMRKIVEATEREQQKFKQLMERFTSLLDERRYREAEDEIAEIIREQEPDLPTAMAAVWKGRTNYHIYEAERIRELRHKNFTLAMHGVETSGIPFADEIPIIYPPAEKWDDLTRRREKYRAVDLAKSGGAEEKIRKVLGEQTDLEFLDTPLKEVVEFLKLKHKIPVELDTKALEGAGVGTDTPVNKNLKGITLRSALRLMLKDLALTYVIRDEVLLITTNEEAENTLITKVYPVADLVVPITTGGAFGPGGGGGFGGLPGGGMAGGGGGMGGGMGGMGGGGMGGMGGGGMGGGGGFFAVKEESLTLGSKSPKAIPTPAPIADDQPRVRRPQKNAAAKIELKIGPGLSSDQAWNEFFANARKDAAQDEQKLAASVRQTVRELMQNTDDLKLQKKNCGEVVTLIQAALRNGHVQPWMYESMGIALQAQNAPAEEIERTLMSAVDFSSNDAEVMHVAQYMARIGLNARALKLYQEVAASNPFSPEAYVSGLTAAQATKDVKGLQWACAGILSQAWPQEHKNVEAKARQIAEATLFDLRKQRKNKEADEFEAACKQAMQRDVVVIGRWNGDADIDIAMAEPAGTICSVQSPRTIGGGVIVGDAFASNGKGPANGYAEAYICPQGFDGEYRMLVKKVWGKVSAGLVTVDIYTHYGSKEQTHIHRNIPVGEKDAVIVFDLKNGRRREALAEEQVANVARNQMNVNQAVLAQQVGAASDSMSSPAIRDVATAWRRGDNVGRFGVNRPGAVGFAPVIRAFPQGQQMDCMAIISADRRYVRFSLLGNQPLSSGIGEVSTFNFVTGQGGVQNGGGGAAGGGAGGAAGGGQAGAGGGLGGGGGGVM